MTSKLMLIGSRTAPRVPREPNDVIVRRMSSSTRHIRPHTQHHRQFDILGYSQEQQHWVTFTFRTTIKLNRARPLVDVMTMTRSIVMTSSNT